STGSQKPFAASSIRGSESCHTMNDGRRTDDQSVKIEGYDVPETSAGPVDRLRSVQVLRTSSSAVRAALAGRLSPQQKRWLSQLRHGELHRRTGAAKKADPSSPLDESATPY